MSLSSLGFWLLWIGLIAYAVQGSPPVQADTFALIQQLLTGTWGDINPLIVALFNLMGIWPFIYIALLLPDGRGQHVPVWPFAVASLGLGAFALLPYLGLRHPNPQFQGRRTGLVKGVDSRGFSVAIALGTVGFLLYGLIAGDWGHFIAEWQTRRFVHVMSLDFCVLCGLVGAVLGDDMARRGMSDRRIYWAVVLVPLLGIITYLCWRPPLLTQKLLDPESQDKPSVASSLE